MLLAADVLDREYYRWATAAVCERDEAAAIWRTGGSDIVPALPKRRRIHFLTDCFALEICTVLTTDQSFSGALIVVLLGFCTVLNAAQRHRSPGRYALEDGSTVVDPLVVGVNIDSCVAPFATNLATTTVPAAPFDAGVPPIQVAMYNSTLAKHSAVRNVTLSIFRADLQLGLFAMNAVDVGL